MSEQIIETQVAPNAFDDASWVEKIADTAQQPAVEENKPEATSEPLKPVDEGKVFDANEYLKEQLGYDDWGKAKQEIEELRQLRDKPKEADKFANETSEHLYKAWLEGKEDEVYSVLDKKRQLSKIEKMEVSKAEEAAEILKLNLQLKHKELTNNEIDYLFKRQFSFPDKPAQTDDQTDEEYQASLSAWTNQVQEIERGMIIDAKLAKPELAKYQNELVLPEISNAAPVQTQPTPEELAQFEQYKTEYFQQVDKGLNDLKGFNSVYKDEEVEIPISYEITAEEKTALKPILEGLHYDFSYFGKRWANADGSINTTLMAEDLYLLENKGNVLKKFANEAGSQRLAHKIKEGSNIKLGGTPQRPFVPDAEKNHQEKQAEAIWAA